MALTSSSDCKSKLQNVLIVLAVWLFVVATALPTTGVVLRVAEHNHSANAQSTHQHLEKIGFENACDDISGVHCGSKTSIAPTFARPLATNVVALRFMFEMQRLASFQFVGDPPPPRL